MKIAERSMLFPESVRFRVEEGLSDAIVQAARQHRITTSEFVRQAVRARLAAEGVFLPPIDAPTQREAA
ncbi:hypothetical protein [Methylobacterium radiotolerans]|uniref:Uncharacterized protein n=1 Tax=Methylobacterium radiotolerans (strain ATCC 27329 / DSM 1819 / JCM 2831 / NBRC 15690 / NCIMB 10815 / 0-1) TaxID=426355 RepID=B1LW63_METRJ|nr:hypothetical protein [Methylobacterium radiotolerans]ACB27126.1 hypothetical protein Mrad2831_5169 [Methylobacterium radiotolerans JCM 2831]GEN00240.1 hypothetical protein MRA01_47790 [Methylobacterium radiotolerans]